MITIALIIVLPASAQEPEWYSKLKEIKLLYSNVQDVIRVYDLSSKLASDQSDFQRYEWNVAFFDGKTEIGSAEFLFKRGSFCPDWNRHTGPGWNVPQWTVIQAAFYWNGKKNIFLDQLPFWTSGFEQIKRANDFVYHSDEQGIWVVTHADRKVWEVHFQPPAAMNSMRCPVTESFDGPIKIIQP